ncbi:arginine--tRNA ligase [Halalkalibacterium halodurans]|jgi:arginyl-tRNA synthetase|uniref:Arginine--tRNA ligase n=1 Tax=Halalkalibacterium halodurans TaxID=86665 RepID=A0A0M0KFH7_ALKHA|nr:arginine--tRNA ligase [Halalkalibacterium halodurans]MED3646464.1 arginine--tRNA ligase [Halalkalibacterium halodurans]TPE69506.1 arginine--tRNA ligase [Halalkalibacterium halodurans]
MNKMEQMKQQLREEIVVAVKAAGLATDETIPEVILETPKEKAHGDFATNMAMQLARVAKKAPRLIAEELTAKLDRKRAAIEKIEIAGPGFINFFLDNSYLREMIPIVLRAESAYGETNVGKGKKVQVEFVSANPTGNLHLGHARGAAVGDALCNILAKAGYDVSREYYINDAGNQINNLALSLEARYFQALGMEKDMPEDGYHGEDIIQFGKDLAETHGDKFVHESSEKRLAFFREYGLKRELEKIKSDLEEFRVPFDNWYSETSLYTTGKVEKTLNVLKEKGKTYEQDGALWFRSTEYGDDKDRVLVKNDGSYTYLTPDISYHEDKFLRGFEKLINIWGADHHGYIPRMKAAIQALGYEKDQLDVQIIQMVSLFQNGEKVKMSKRTGKAVTLRDLMEEVGIDATRYFFAMRSADSHLDFDMDLAVSKSNENPVYYVQYAHARVCSMLRKGKELGLSFDESTDLSPIASEKEYDLLKKIGEFPEVVAEAAQKQMPHRITNYVHELASTLHSFYNAEQVINPENDEQSKARLALMKATQVTLKNALSLVGVEAPERM